MSDVQSGGKLVGAKLGPKVIAHMKITPTANDGHIVEHHHQLPTNTKAPMHPMEHHSFGAGEDQAMLDHLAKHLQLETQPDATHEEEQADHSG